MIRSYKCRACGKSGHNKRSCPNVDVGTDSIETQEAREPMANRRSKKPADIATTKRGDVAPPLSIDEVNDQVEADDEGDADFAAVKESGAVSASSVAFNEHTKALKEGKKQNIARRVRWNDDNAQNVFDNIRSMGWNMANTYINVRRVTGSPEQWSVEASGIANGLALYQWVLRNAHRSSKPESYEVRVHDSHANCERGRGMLLMPDTTAAAEAPPPPVPPQPPPQQYYPSPYPYQFGGAPPGMMGAPPAAPPAPQAPPAAPPSMMAQSQVDPGLLMQINSLQSAVAHLLGRIDHQQQVAAHQPPPAPTPVVIQAPAPSAEQTQIQNLQDKFDFLVRRLDQMGRVAAPPPPAPAPAQPPSPAPPIGLAQAPAQAAHQQYQQSGPVPSAVPAQMPQILSRAASPIEAFQEQAKAMRQMAGSIKEMLSSTEDIRNLFNPTEEPEEKEPSAPVAGTVVGGGSEKKPFEVMELGGGLRMPFDPETGDAKGIVTWAMTNADVIGKGLGYLLGEVAKAQAVAAGQQNPNGEPPQLPPNQMAQMASILPQLPHMVRPPSPFQAPQNGFQPPAGPEAGWIPPVPVPGWPG